MHWLPNSLGRLGIRHIHPRYPIVYSPLDYLLIYLLQDFILYKKAEKQASSFLSVEHLFVMQFQTLCCFSL